MIDDKVEGLIEFTKKLWLGPQILLIISTGLLFVAFYVSGSMWLGDVPYMIPLTLMKKSLVFYFVHFFSVLIISKFAGWHE